MFRENYGCLHFYLHPQFHGRQRHIYYIEKDRSCLSKVSWLWPSFLSPWFLPYHHHLWPGPCLAFPGFWALLHRDLGVTSSSAQTSRKGPGWAPSLSPVQSHSPSHPTATPCIGTCSPAAGEPLLSGVLVPVCTAHESPRSNSQGLCQPGVKHSHYLKNKLCDSTTK